MGMPVRPTAMEELQAASAVGQGPLYDVYGDLLAEHGVRTAQVLLTFFDVSARMQYLNARRTLGTLIDWGVVPVINENDTTATDEISFGDNDILAAQVAILLPADLLVVLSDVDALYTSDPRRDAGAERVAEVRELRELENYEIGMSSSHLGSSTDNSFSVQLRVTDSQSQKLFWAEQNGKLSLELRPPADSQDSFTVPDNAFTLARSRG